MHIYHDRRFLIPFRSALLPQIFTDVLVIGTGVAGLRTAIEAAAHGDVIVIAKEAVDLSNTSWAQGGIAAVLSDQDTVASHVADTLEAGAGLCDIGAVNALVDEGRHEIARLLEWGMRIDRAADGSPALGLEGGHHHARIVHTDGDATGYELARCLIERVRATRGIRVFDRCFVIDLLRAADGSGRVLGALTWHPRYGLQIMWARATVLASGGAGQVFRETTNPKVATGDGVAMAWRAGAELSDLEFFQFHPTALYVAGAGRMLISEAVRGEGAHLVNRNGDRFMQGLHPMAELAPRDVVSKSIVRHLAGSGESHIFLDCRHFAPGRFVERFPGLARMLAGFDIDPTRDRIPVTPAAHYMIGGVRTDLDGRTSLPGLWACGEVAANGVHGANRLASNSLLDGLVFGRRVAVSIAREAPPDVLPRAIVSEVHTAAHGELDLADIRSSLRSAMWRNVGIERSGAHLTDVLSMFAFWGRYGMDEVFSTPEGWEVQNLLTVGLLMTRAALARSESRGTHQRTDVPATDPAQAHHVAWSINQLDPVVPALGSAGVAAGHPK
jgi:L-aspartate oxidase